MKVPRVQTRQRSITVGRKLSEIHVSKDNHEYIHADSIVLIVLYIYSLLYSISCMQYWAVVLLRLNLNLTVRTTKIDLKEDDFAQSLQEGHHVEPAAFE